MSRVRGVKLSGGMLQCFVVWCGVAWRGVVRCGVMWRGVVW